MAGIAAIISADPAIAGRLTRVANSAILGGQSACQSVQDALVRLGIQRAQNIVLTLATKDLFVAQAPHLKDRMLKRWRHAIDIAALCAVLAKMTPGMDGDRALLLGLIPPPLNSACWFWTKPRPTSRSSRGCCPELTCSSFDALKIREVISFPLF